MKRKIISGKLLLSKRTIARLNLNDFQKLNGGNKTGITCGRLCETIDYTCAETQCGTCYHTCPPTWCDTECGC